MHHTDTIDPTVTDRTSPEAPVVLTSVKPAIADLGTYRAVHTAIRLAPHRMASAVRTVRPDDHRRIRALTRYWHGYAEEVLTHHRLEDDVFFPALVDRAPSLRAIIDRTDEEHHELDRLMAAAEATVVRFGRDATRPVREDLADRLLDLARLMDAHLDLEDAELLPAFERYFAADDYHVLEQQAMKALGISAQAAFAVPFVVASVAPHERTRLMEHAPAPFRILYRLTRGRHARLTALALGESGFLQVVAP